MTVWNRIKYHERKGRENKEKVYIRVVGVNIYIYIYRKRECVTDLGLFCALLTQLRWERIRHFGKKKKKSSRATWCRRRRKKKVILALYTPRFFLSRRIFHGMLRKLFFFFKSLSLSLSLCDRYWYLKARAF